MPTLITLKPQKRESRPEAAFDSRRQCRSTLRVLLAPPCLVQADLLSLDLARIASHQTRRAEAALQSRIILDEGAGDAVAHRAGLAALAATVDVHEDVEGREVLRQLERLANHHAPGLAAEELVHRLAVHHEAALAGLEEHARHGALAPAGAVVVVANHCARSPEPWAVAPSGDACRRRRPSACAASR